MALESSLQYRSWPQECCHVMLHVKLCRNNTLIPPCWTDTGQAHRPTDRPCGSDRHPRMSKSAHTQALGKSLLIFLYFPNSKHLTFSRPGRPQLVLLRGGKRGKPLQTLLTTVSPKIANSTKSCLEGKRWGGERSRREGRGGKRETEKGLFQDLVSISHSLSWPLGGISL